MDPFCYSEALEFLGGEEDLLLELIEILAGQLDADVERVRASLAGGDTEEVVAEAHRLKGAVGAIAGKRLAAVAQELEDLAASGTLDGADKILERVSEEAVLLRAALETALAEC